MNNSYDNEQKNNINFNNSSINNSSLNNTNNNSISNSSLNNVNNEFYNQQVNNNLHNINANLIKKDNINVDDSDFSNNKVIKRKPNIIIVLIIIIIGLGGFKIFSNLFLGGNHKNNTGSSEYSSKDVDLNCVYTSNDSNKQVTLYSDFLFNYKSKGETSYNYSVKIYTKKINVYPNGLTDEIYNDFINQTLSSYCGGFTGISCTDSHLEFGMTDFGWDTIVDRSENKIIMTYYSIYGLGQTATKKDINEMKKAYEAEEYKCN